MNKKLRLGISFSTAIMTALIAVTITNASTKTTKKTTKAKVTATAKAKAKKVVAKAKPKTTKRVVAKPKVNPDLVKKWRTYTEEGTHSEQKITVKYYGAAWYYLTSDEKTKVNESVIAVDNAWWAKQVAKMVANDKVINDNNSGKNGRAAYIAQNIKDARTSSNNAGMTAKQWSNAAIVVGYNFDYNQNDYGQKMRQKYYVDDYDVENLTKVFKFTMDNVAMKNINVEEYYKAYIAGVQKARVAKSNINEVANINPVSKDDFVKQWKEYVAKNAFTWEKYRDKLEYAFKAIKLTQTQQDAIKKKIDNGDFKSYNEVGYYIKKMGWGERD